MAPDVTIALEDPRQSNVVRLIRTLDKCLDSLYPAKSNHLIDIDALAGRDIRFLVARKGSRVFGCAALKLHSGKYGEIKRMFVLPEARGQKYGWRILNRIEELARAENLRCLRLETGIYQTEALALFRSAGFRERGPFGDYRSDPLSLFLEKTL